MEGRYAVRGRWRTPGPSPARAVARATRRHGHPGRGLVVLHLRPVGRHRRRRAPRAVLPGHAVPVRVELRVNGQAPEPLAADSDRAVLRPRSSSAARPRAGRADSTLVVFRNRYVGAGMREDIDVRNYGEEAAYCSRRGPGRQPTSPTCSRSRRDASPADGQRRYRARRRRHGLHRSRRATAARRLDSRSASRPQDRRRTLVSFEVDRAARGSAGRRACRWRRSSTARRSSPATGAANPWSAPRPSERLQRGGGRCRSSRPTTTACQVVVQRSAEDLGALRIFDPDYPERAVVAAGAPWFMTLFGRDSLLTRGWRCWSIPTSPSACCRRWPASRATKVDPRTEEEPGRILHEMRFGGAPTRSRSAAAASTTAAPTPRRCS